MHSADCSGNHKAQKLATCRSLLNRPAPVPAVVESEADFMRRLAGMEISQRAQCAHGHMRVAAALAPLRTTSSRPNTTGPPA
jgi:hypothetical protein